MAGRWTAQQAPHGGQDWREIPNFVEDFSVTTNGCGPPKRAMQAAREALETISHYPAADCEPAVSSLARFLGGGHGLKERLLLGNGASELIDMVVRAASPGPHWRPGNVVQYKEYERSCSNQGRVMLNGKEANLFCLVNPVNPTGYYIGIELLKARIAEGCDPDTTVIVDESMQPWFGPKWREDSLVSQENWIAALARERRIFVYIIHSWTKLWSCPGLRVGSVIAPTLDAASALRRNATPWPMNSCAIAFLEEVTRDDKYLLDTWEATRAWRQGFVSRLRAVQPEWEFFGEEWLSYIWIDAKSEEAAIEFVARCRSQGVPIRWGGMGYNCPTYVRVAVRHPDKASIVVACADEKQ